METNDRINKTSKEKQQRQFKENVISATDGLKKNTHSNILICILISISTYIQTYMSVGQVV